MITIAKVYIEINQWIFGIRYYYMVFEFNMASKL